MSDRAAERYRAAEELFAAGRSEGALEALERVLALSPDYPNAHNLAGYVLLRTASGDVARLTRAVEHFEAALTRDPENDVPRVNLADALLALGRDDAAVERMQRARSSTRTDNWLGWYYSERAGDLERALPLLERAARSAGWWGPAHQNYARALERAGRPDDAYEEYRLSLASGDAHDPGFVHERRSLIEEARGWPRHALSSIRRAFRHAGRASYRARELELCEKIAASGRYFPHPSSERRWIEWELADKREGLGLEPDAGTPTLSAVERRLMKARRSLEAEPRASSAREALERIRQVALARALPVELAGASFEIDLEEIASPDARKRVSRLLDDFERVHRWLYAEACAKDVPPTGPLSPVEELLRQGELEAAVRALRELSARDAGVLVDAIGLTEAAGESARLAGRRDQALALLELALDGYSIYASWATSGGEGMSRMLDVKRLEQRVQALRRGL